MAYNKYLLNEYIYVYLMNKKCLKIEKHFILFYYFTPVLCVLILSPFLVEGIECQKENNNNYAAELENAGLEAPESTSRHP